MDSKPEVTVESLQQTAEEYERNGRTAQARIIRLVLADIEAGSPWLDRMNKGCN